MTAAAGWTNFYVIVGSSAGALIGLQFVVITLIADMPIEDGMLEASGVYATPTIVHLGTVLLLSALLAAPWQGIAAPAALWGVVGFVGTVYEMVVAWRMRAQIAYRPELEDWLFHFLVPFLAYATFALSAFTARLHARGTLFAVAAAALLLLFVGIHNAWDNVTYNAFVKKRAQREAERRPAE
jgi:hypothetical protein